MAASTVGERIIMLWFRGWPGEIPEGEEANFAPLFTGLTELVPEIEEIRPGLVAMRSRGPARYYGGEAEAATALLAFATDAGFPDARVGIADGRFTAEGAAFTAPSGEPTAHPNAAITIVPAGQSAAFLSSMPVAVGADERLAQLLPGLGIYTLGAYAALPEDAVRARFGPSGVRLHRHARGLDAERGEEIRPQHANRDLAMTIEFEPPLAGTEQLAFACSTLAERLSTALIEERLVCTTLRVTLTDDIGVLHERDWAHPRFFSPSDTLARIRWQAEGLHSGKAAHTERAGAGIAAVRIAPIRTDRTAAHEPGLWTTGADERIHHHLSRAQGLLGPGGVGTLALEGGRLLHERQRFTSWGSAPRSDRKPGPWPGGSQPTQPSLVFQAPVRARLLDAHGAPIEIDEDDLLAARPHNLMVEGYRTEGAVRGWSRPWPIRERWWAGRPDRFRLQLELESGDGWVLIGRIRADNTDGTNSTDNTSSAPTEAPHSRTTWFAEGHYD